MKKIDYSKVYSSRGIWELWHDKTWDDFVEPFYKNAVKKFVKDEIKRNVLLYGSNGAGKSMLMNLAMKDLMHKGYDVRVIDFRHLVKEYTKSWRNEGKLPVLMMADYLAIDDLGKEFSSSGVSKELAVTTIDYVLRYRFQRKKSTWLTFNMMLGEIETAYNVDIASLLKRSSVALAFDEEDFGDRMFKKITKKGTKG